MSRFANLADRAKEPQTTANANPRVNTSTSEHVHMSTPAPSRIGRKAISGYFPPELSLAMHHCARKHDLSLQDLMAEAFNDVLRKYGECPVGG